MSAKILLLPTLLALSVYAAPAAYNGPSTSVTADSTCITRYRRHGDSVSSIPTSTRTSCQTASSTVIITASAATETSTLTPDAVTVTKVVNATVGAGASVVDTTTVFTTFTVEGSGRVPGCESTMTASASATATVYTGSYEPTIAKRSVGGLLSLSLIDREADRSNAWSKGFVHNYGYSPQYSSQSKTPFEVDCLKQETTYLVATSTASLPAQTSTITASTPIVTVTSTSTTSLALSSSSPLATVTSTVTITLATSPITDAICTTTPSNPATATTTQHLKCAPTNLISSITDANGTAYGISQTQASSDVTEGLAPGSDASACCQLCVDTEGCAASADDPSAGNCFLWYTSPSCGVGFRYTGDSGTEAGEGFLVQTGCGSVEAV